ncbi:Non-specific lipid-transfer protein-like [Oopsacas minuta]|uniref:Sterol carrier protein 2 n=1 Tax=Oopsacas minuta TaxID=111878 RepID=A0AAV7JVL0_9METZ|nr:Non-specific lipid-transfer protein-like [Oopsacas minuta]
MSNKRAVYVLGVGMTKFEKPGRRDNFDYPDMALEAARNALADAKISYKDVQQVCCGYTIGDSTCGQRAVYQLGMTGIPVYNVNNNCSTGSTALLLARYIVQGGVADCVMALGFDKMHRGPIKSGYTDRVNPMDKHVEVMFTQREMGNGPITAQMFGNAGREHMEKYGSNPDHFAKIAYKNHKHSVNNPNAQFQQHYTLEEVKASRLVHDPLTLLQCCPTSDGAGCVIVCSLDFLNKTGLHAQAVEILAMEMRTDFPSTFEEKSSIKLVGYDLSKSAADSVYKQTGYNANDVDVIELHDCFSANELITYEALGLCPPGKAGNLIDRGDNTYGGKWVVNPSGGLISKGHPLGATGLAQCTELCWQLRGQAGPRQVKGAKLALQHNLGLGGAVVVTMYRLGFPHLTYDAKTPYALSHQPCSGGNLKSEEFFKLIAENMEENGADLVKKVKGSYLFKITGGPGGLSKKWVVDLKNGNGSVKEGDGKADCTIMISDDNFADMVSGKLNGQKAFFQGKLKLSGNMALAMKLQAIMPSNPNSKL